MMYHCHIWTSNMGYRGGVPPPSISWFSSTPAEIGLIFKLNEHFKFIYNVFQGD